MQANNDDRSQSSTSDEELRILIIRFIQLIAVDIAQRLLADKRPT